MGNNWIWMAVYGAALIALFYFIGIRPSRKRNKERFDMLSYLEPGDFVLTTSGFYGEVVDVQDDTVVVEFGSNKNCRIAMKKDAIEQVEKATPGNYAGAKTAEAKEKSGK